MRKTSLAFLFILCLCFAGALPAAAADNVAYVDFTNGKNTNDGLTPATAKQYISAALGLLPNGGTLLLSGKCQPGNYTINLGGDLRITSVEGATDYRANNSNCVFQMGESNVLTIAGNVTMDKMTLHSPHGTSNILRVKNGATLTVEDVLCTSDTGVYFSVEVEAGGTAILRGGKFTAVSGAGNITIDGAEIVGYPISKTGIVYVANGGKGDGSSADSPLSSLAIAGEALGGKGGEIVLVGDLTVDEITTIPEQSEDLLLRAENGARLLLGKRLQLAKNTNANTVTLDLPVDVTTNYLLYFFGGFNSIVFGEHFEILKSGGEAAALHFYGGVLSDTGTPCADVTTELPYSITVNGGDFDMFSAGNFRLTLSAPVGSIAAPVDVTINGGSFGKETGTVDYTSNNKVQSDLANEKLFSLSGMSILADDATLTINGGSFHAPVFIVGQMRSVPVPATQVSDLTASDRRYYAIDGDITVHIHGGVFNGGLFGAYYTQAAYTTLIRGNYDVTIDEGAVFADGTVFDATQVKPYAGSDKKATIRYPATLLLDVVRFDEVNGAAQTYSEPTRVAFIGDSITEGVSPAAVGLIRQTESYPALFLAHCEENGEEVIVANYGVSGSGLLPSTARDFYKMLAYPLLLEETDADIYFIAMGTNDGKTAATSHALALEFEDRYRTLLTDLSALPDTKHIYTSTVLFRNTTSIIGDLANAAIIRPTQMRVTAELAAKMPEMFTMVDLYALTFATASRGELLSTDGIHPDREGYAVMGEIVYNALHGGATEVEDFRRSEVYVDVKKGGRFATGAADDPVDCLKAAFARLDLTGDATVHISGSLTQNCDVFLPAAAGKLTLISEGENARLTTSGTVFCPCGDTEIDNLTLNAANSAAWIYAGYHNLTLGAGVTTAGSWSFAAGHPVEADRETVDLTKDAYDTVEAVSSDADLVLTLYGGDFISYLGGNRRICADAPIGTYSGNMTLTIGKNAKIRAAGATQIGISGMNYLTGSITAEIDGWNAEETVPDIPEIGPLPSPDAYAHTRNSGSITIAANAPLSITGDFNGDGKLTLADTLILLRAYLDNRFTAEMSEKYYGIQNPKLLDVLSLLKRIAK